MKVLAVGAHPDDIELGCGGTIALHSFSNHSVFTLVLSNGERSGDPDARRKETINSSKILGIKQVFFGGLPDTKIGNDISTISIIENIINKIKPDIVLTHSEKEVHQDHRNTALSTFSAARNVLVLLSYETPTSLRYFLPQLFVCIDRTIDVKIKALKEFHSQTKKRYMELDAIIGLAKFRGYTSKTKFAEAYEVIRIIKKETI